jgi:hypothetical protein
MYYVVTDLGYDGVVVFEFLTEAEARKKFNQDAKEVELDEEGNAVEDSYSFGVELLYGMVLSKKGDAIQR